MRNIEQFISPLIQEQFPDFYREEGRLFITFAKAYYEWLENNLQEIVVAEDLFEVEDEIMQNDAKGIVIAKTGKTLIVKLSTRDRFITDRNINNISPAFNFQGAYTYILEERNYNTVYLSRNLLSYRNINTTIDEFITNFKNKYLYNVQFNTASNKELFIKNALDFYRAKGTERAVDLFFKLIYGFEAKVYTPGNDVFRLSDNNWVQSEYLEVEYNRKNVEFVGKYIVGANSLATAFVERLVRIKRSGKYINVLYISTREKDFISGEQIYLNDRNSITTRIVGSLNSVNMITSNSGFLQNDILNTVNENGKGAIGIVTETRDYDGIVQHRLLTKGWGYSDETKVIGSDIVFDVNDIKNTNDQYQYFIDPYKQFESLKQRLLTIEANTSLVANEIVLFTDSLSNPIANGYVIDENNITIDNLTANTNNFAFVNGVEITNISSTVSSANVIGCSSQYTIEYSIDSGVAVSNNDILYQIVNHDVDIVKAKVLSQSFDPIDSKYEMVVDVECGSIRTNLPLSSNTSTYTINKMSGRVGVFDDAGIFYNGFIIGEESGTIGVGTVYRYSTKSIMEIVNKSSNRKLIENYYSPVPIFTLPNYDTLPIQDVLFAETGNTNPTIDEIGSFRDVYFSSIDEIRTSFYGEGYPVSPFYIIHDPTTYHLERYDYIIQYDDTDVFYEIGETVSGLTSGSTGIITKIEGDKLHVTRTSLGPDKITGEEFIIGEGLRNENGVTVNIINVYEDRKSPRTGLNALVESNALSGDGLVLTMKIVSSGFGYLDRENIEFYCERDKSLRVIAAANVNRQGKGVGYFKNRKSFLSSDKYLHDNEYYQDYSYEVLTSLPFEVYKDTLVDVLHVAGTKVFGSYVSTTKTELNITPTSISTTSIS